MEGIWSMRGMSDYGWVGGAGLDTMPHEGGRVGRGAWYLRVVRMSRANPAHLGDHSRSGETRATEMRGGGVGVGLDVYTLTDIYSECSG